MTTTDRVEVNPRVMLGKPVIRGTRVGRPSLGGGARRLIAIRLDPDVLSRFRMEAKRKVGYQTLINRVLAEYVGKDVA